MPEETGTPETMTQTVPAAPNFSSATEDSFIESDGTFKQGWQDHWIPKEVHARNTMLWSGMKNVKDLIVHINNQDQAISRQGKGIFPPGEHATESEIRLFHRALGVPERPEDYTLQIPDEVKPYYQDKELLGEAKRILHRAGLTPNQFASVMALDATRMKRAEEAMKADPMAFYEEALDLAMPVMRATAEKALRAKWGDAYDARLQLANVAITENTQEGDERNQLLERIGNDPLVADLIATIQNKHHTESHGVDTSLGGGSKYMNVDQQIQFLMRDPNYIDGKTNPLEHKRLIEEVHRLHAQKTGGKMLE